MPLLCPYRTHLRYRYLQNFTVLRNRSAGNGETFFRQNSHQLLISIWVFLILFFYSIFNGYLNNFITDGFTLFIYNSFCEQVFKQDHAERRINILVAGNTRYG